MRHFVAYHNAEKMGHEGISRLRVVTNKPVTDDLIGQCVWVVLGTGIRPKSYALASHFIIGSLDECRVPGFVHELLGDDGRVFDPPIVLDDLEWFHDLRKALANFSLGFREISDRRCICELEAVSTRNSENPVES